jgi:hypothetical protein
MDGVTQIGTFTDPAGRGWTVARDDGAAFTMFRPTDGSDVQGTIYWKEMLAFLISKSVITGAEYFNGIAFGPEPRLGNGAAQLSLTVDYA